MDENLYKKLLDAIDQERATDVKIGSKTDVLQDR
jgi:hypothetical protein